MNDLRNKRHDYMAHTSIWEHRVYHFTRGPFLLLISFWLTPITIQWKKSLFYFLLIDKPRNCIIEIVNAYTLFWTKINFSLYFWDGILQLFTSFRLLSSSLLLYSWCFGCCILQPSSGDISWNFELNSFFYSMGVDCCYSACLHFLFFWYLSIS